MPAATSTPVATAVPTSTPTRTPTLAVTGAVCANLSGEWESDWTFCTRTQENPGPSVFFAQTGCTFTAAILGLGTMSGTISGTISGTGESTRISWSFATTSPCTGTATGVATIDTSMGQTIYFRFDNPAGWSCAGGCSSPPLIAFRRDLPTPTPAMHPRR